MTQTSNSEPLSADVRERVDALTRQAYAARFVGAANALPLAEEALRLARHAEYRLGEGRALSAAAALRSRQLDLDRALIEATEAAEILLGAGDKTEYGLARMIQGNIHVRRGNLTEAFQHYTAALEVALSLADRAAEAEIRHNIAMARRAAGDLGSALEEIRVSLDIHEQLANEDGAARARFSMGSVLGDLGQWDEALRIHEPAVEFHRGRGELSLAAMAECNIGVYHWLRRDHEAALGHFEAARDLAGRVGDFEVEVHLLTNIARVHSEMGDSAGALARFHEVLAAADAHNLPIQRASAYLGIGQALAASGAADDALATLLKALDSGATGAPLDQRAEIHGALAAVYETKGLIDRALFHFKTYHELDARRRSAEAERQVVRVMVDAERRERQRESEHLRQRAELLERLSREDALTGLANRRDWDERLNTEWERASRFQHAFTIALADIDHFKSINDRFSHATGDAVLRAVATIMRQQLRQSDLVARHGGEEFSFLFVETAIADARRVCERIRTAVAEHDWQSVADGLGVTISIGLVDGLAYHSPVAAVAAADARLYRAKRLGRDQTIDDEPSQWRSEAP